MGIFEGDTLISTLSDTLSQSSPTKSALAPIALCGLLEKQTQCTWTQGHYDTEREQICGEHLEQKSIYWILQNKLGKTYIFRIDHEKEMTAPMDHRYGVNWHEHCRGWVSSWEPPEPERPSNRSSGSTDISCWKQAKSPMAPMAGIEGIDGAVWQCPDDWTSVITSQPHEGGQIEVLVFRVIWVISVVLVHEGTAIRWFEAFKPWLIGLNRAPNTEDTVDRDAP